MERWPRLWLCVCLLLIAVTPLLIPAAPTGMAAPQARPPYVLPPNLALVEQWRREGRPLPPFIDDPDFFSTGEAGWRPHRTVPLSGTLNVLAVVVDFDDKVHTVAATFLDQLLFALPVAGRGSVRDYWGEVSYAQVDIVTVDLPSSIDWVRAPSNYTYYTNGSYCIGGYPNNCQRLAEEVVDAVDSVVNFSLYDNDGDGYTEPIVLIHAGPEGYLTGDPWDIWGHSWSLASYRFYDGVTIADYTITAEYWTTVEPGWSDMTIGPVCHEIGHGFWDLPDVYDHDNSSAGLGRWSLMSNGWTNGPNAGAWGVDGSSPAWPDAFNRILAGFDSPYTVFGPSDPHTFSPIETAPGAIARLKSAALRPQEVFLLENRQRLPGSYDEYLPGDGLFIWHVDASLPFYGGNDNECRHIPHCSGDCAATHYLVALEQADGYDHLELLANLGDPGDPFPGSSGRTFWQTYAQNPGVNPESGSWFDTGCQTDSCLDLTAIACAAGGDCTAAINQANCGTESDLGDAPASRNHFAVPMTAYAAAGPWPAVEAGFATVFVTDTLGPRHHFGAIDAWLGSGLSGEFDADLGPDEDGPSNISPTLDVADRDGEDDGVLWPIPLAPCADTSFAYTVTVAPYTAYGPRYVNAWFDWNRDGDWSDVLTCTGGITTAERAVADQVLNLGPGVYRRNTPVFRPWIAIAPRTPWEAWMRLSLAEIAAPAPQDGRGPLAGYDYGETEDAYLFLSPTLAISAGLTSPDPGSLVTYTIRLSGAGNVVAQGTVLSDVLPLGIEYVDSSPSGTYDPGTRTITWPAALSPEAPTLLALTVEVVGTLGDVITNPVSLSWAGSPWTDAAATFVVGCAPDDPMAAFTWTVPACLSETIHFTSLSSGTLPLSLSWDLDGDGLVDSTAPAPTWQYGLPGLYTVTLTATNVCGWRAVHEEVTVAAPLTALVITGPAALWVNQAGTYTATAVPAGPAMYEWSNGMQGVTTTYSWSTPGWHTVAVTASNGCSALTATQEVSVSVCTALTGLAVSGPPRLRPGEEGLFLAVPQPLTATSPAYLWSDGSSASSTVYSWTLPGRYTVTVRATNCLDAQASAALPVAVGAAYSIYLPVVFKGGP